MNKSKFVSHLSNEQGTNQFGSFDAAYRGNSRPRPERAWEIGEALRDEGGVPWASGLWFLWACGHLGDTIGVIATYMRMRRDVLSINECDAAWHMVAMSSTLARVTALDQTPPFASIHINKPSLDVETIADLKTWYDAHCHTAEEVVHSALTHTLFLEREAAKFAFPKLWRDARHDK